MRARARTLLGGVAVLAAVVLAGCASSASKGGSTVTATGSTLSIYLSVPPGASGDPAQQDLIDAEKLACKADRREVTDFGVQCITVAKSELSANARAAIQDQSSIAYVGELAPGSSQDSVGITNALQLLQISPTDTALELTRSTPAVPGAPSKFYESWSSYGRTYAHVVPSSAQEATALVAEMRALGVSSLYVADDGSDYGSAIAHAVQADAAPSVTIAGSESTAGAIFYGASSPAAGARFMNSAATLDPNAKLFGSSALDTAAFASALSAVAARNTYISAPGFLPSDLPPTARTSFIAPFTAAYGHAPAPQAIFGFAAVDALFGVLRQAGANANNRATVTKDFLKLNDPTSVLGAFSIEPDGDTSPASFVINRVRGGEPVAVASAP